MKTYKKWEKSGVDFDQFVNPTEEVDAEMFDHFSAIVPPKFFHNGVFQVGECEYIENDIEYYSTFCEIGSRYYYLGKLPEFKK